MDSRVLTSTETTEDTHSHTHAHAHAHTHTGREKKLSLLSSVFFWRPLVAIRCYCKPPLVLLHEEEEEEEEEVMLSAADGLSMERLSAPIGRSLS